MMCFTRRTSTAYCMQDRQFASACSTTLATLRCTKSSPGGSPTISFAGTRLSEQPTHRYCGACWLVRRVKNAGSCRVIFAAQVRLLAKSSLKNRNLMLGRRALFDEGVHAGAALLVGEAGGDHARGELVGLLQAEIHLLVERSLACGYGCGRFCSKGSCKFHHRAVELLWRDDPIDKTPFQGALGINGLAGEKHLHSVLALKVAPDGDARGRAEKAPGDAARDELRR